MTRLDIAEQRFGSLVALYPASRDKNRKWKWVCRCDCGKEVEVYASHLVSGHTSSCGCKEGYHTHGSSYTRLYHIWDGMKQRCNNPNNHGYKWYGGKGIKLDPIWKSFESFKYWATNSGYTDELCIDRINPIGDYTPHNCEWVTPSENSKRRFKYDTH